METELARSLSERIERLEHIQGFLLMYCAFLRLDQDVFPRSKRVETQRFEAILRKGVREMAVKELRLEDDEMSAKLLELFESASTPE